MLICCILFLQDFVDGMRSFKVPVCRFDLLLFVYRTCSSYLLGQDNLFCVVVAWFICFFYLFRMLAFFLYVLQLVCPPNQYAFSFFFGGIVCFFVCAFVLWINSGLRTARLPSIPAQDPLWSSAITLGDFLLVFDRWRTLQRTSCSPMCSSFALFLLPSPINAPNRDHTNPYAPIRSDPCMFFCVFFQNTMSEEISRP